ISHFKIKFCHSTVRSFNTQLYHYSTPAHRHTQTPPTLAHSQTHTAQHTHTHTHSDTQTPPTSPHTQTLTHTHTHTHTHTQSLSVMQVIFLPCGKAGLVG